MCCNTLARLTIKLGFITIILAVVLVESIKKWKNQRVILVSIDGFRWDYLEKMKDYLPNLNKYKEAGATVEYVKNVFPTNTMPNHFSIVTGLYPEHHGIIDNSMFDPITGREFNLESNDTFWWSWAEPIWITNSRQGHKSAVIYYPGYDVKFNGSMADYHTANMPYDKPFASGGNTMPLKKRIDLLLGWMRNDSRLNFAALYMEQIDSITHDLSPDGSNMPAQRASAFKEVDNAIDYLMKSLVLSEMQDNVNIIVIGDHGQTDVNNTKMIDLAHFIAPQKYMKRAIGMTDVFVFPRDNKTLDIYNKIKGKHPHMHVYLKNDIPIEFHIKNCNRTSPMLLLADPGWLINTTFDKLEYHQGVFLRGEHGYTNAERKMNPGFAAWGPCFIEGSKVESIENVDIYSTICHILNIKPRKNDGKLKRMQSLLHFPHELNHTLVF